jgi:hypothetical protein
MYGRQGIYDYWAAAATWLVDLSEDLHVSGNVQVTAYISSTFQLGWFEGGGYGMGLVEAYDNGTIINEFIVQGPTSWGNPFTPTPKAYTLSLDVDYVFPKDHMLGFFVGVGSNRQGFIADVYFDSSDRNSCAILSVVTQVEAYEYNVVLEEGTFQVVTLSNSNLSNFGFSRSEKQISFDVSGSPCTTGYCEVWIPKILLGPPYKVFFDSQQIIPTQTGNDTHVFVSFTYVHGSSTIRIVGASVIPEYPSFIILPLLMIAALLIAILLKKRQKPHE